MTSRNAPQPLGLFLTWTTYGTWLPGDARGHVSNTLLPDGRYVPRENRFGADFRQGSESTRERARQLQRGETVWLNQLQAKLAAESLIQSAVARNWCIQRGAVMSSHVHVLVTDCPADPSTVQRILKGGSQQSLSRSVGESRRWWTRKGSQRFLYDDEAVGAVSRYIENQRAILSFIRENEIAIP